MLVKELLDPPAGSTPRRAAPSFGSAPARLHETRRAGPTSWPGFGGVALRGSGKSPAGGAPSTRDAGLRCVVSSQGRYRPRPLVQPVYDGGQKRLPRRGLGRVKVPPLWPEATLRRRCRRVEGDVDETASVALLIMARQLAIPPEEPPGKSGGTSITGIEFDHSARRCEGGMVQFTDIPVTLHQGLHQQSVRV